MTHKLLNLLFVCSLFVGLAGCFDSDTDVGGEDGNSNKFYRVLTIKSGSLTIDDTIWFDIDTEADNFYTLDKGDSEDYSLDFVVVTPSGDSVNSSTFKSNVDGAFHVGLYVKDAKATFEGPVYYSVLVKKFSPLPENISGKWLLIKEAGTAFGESSVHPYSATEAKSLMEISLDSVYRMKYSPYNDNVNSNCDHFVDSWLSHMDYYLSGNNLTLSSKCAQGEHSYLYTRFEDDVEDLQWAYDIKDVPSDLIGAWYLADVNWRRVDNEISGEIIDEAEVNNYNSAAESPRIIEVTSSSINQYVHKNGVTKIDKGMSLREFYWLLIRENLSGHNYTYRDCLTDVWIDNKGTEMTFGYMDIRTYKKYSGELPPKEWTTSFTPAPL